MSVKKSKSYGEDFTYYSIDFTAQIFIQNIYTNIYCLVMF